MVRHLVTNGTRVPPQLVQATDQFEAGLAKGGPVDMAALAATHERLSRLVAPAKPGTLRLLDSSLRQAGAGPSSLGPIKLVRDMVRVAIGCVAVFIALSVIALVDAHEAIDLFNVEGPAAQAQDSHTLLVIKIVLQRVFWLAAAGIGASFAMLFQLNDQIVSRTFDPDESSSYWVKFFLGLVAGFILVALLPIDTGTGTQGAVTGTQALAPPTIALLGGFSASAVYRILTRMVEALESVFSGGVREQAAAAEKAGAARAAEEGAQARMAVAAQLVDLQQRMAAGMSPEEASAQLRQVVAALVPSSSDAAPAAPADGKVPAYAVVGPAAEDDAGTEDTGAPAEASAEDAGARGETAAAVG